MTQIDLYKVICIIPTLNEEATVADVIKKAKQTTSHVVVVDGNSVDETSENAWKAGARVLIQDGEGKGMALRTVFDKIKGDIYVTIDGDATYDAEEMKQLIQPILQGEADMVIGSRLQGEMEEGSISKMNMIGNWLFNSLINVLFHGQITDSQSGFRAMTHRMVETFNLISEGFEVETEMTITALKCGLKIREIPITYVRRRGSPSKLNSFKAGYNILKTIILSFLNIGKT